MSEIFKKTKFCYSFTKSKSQMVKSGGLSDMFSTNSSEDVRLTHTSEQESNKCSTKLKLSSLYGTFKVWAIKAGS